MLNASKENKAKAAYYGRPAQTSFGVDLNPSRPPLANNEPSNDGLGSEFIEELRDESGQVIRVFCNLCKFDIDNEELKMLHLTGQKHSTLYKERMEKYQGGFSGGGGGNAGPPGPSPQQQAPPQGGNGPPMHMIQQQLDQQIQQLNLPAPQQDAFVQQLNMQVQSMLQQPNFMKQFDGGGNGGSGGNANGGGGGGFDGQMPPFPPMSQYNYPPNGPPSNFPPNGPPSNYPPYNQPDYPPYNQPGYPPYNQPDYPPYNQPDYPPPPPNFNNRPGPHFGKSPPPFDSYQDKPQFGISLHQPTRKPYGFNRPSKPSNTYTSEAEDDNDLLVKEKHTLIYPTSKQFTAVRKVLADSDKWLKQVQVQPQNPTNIGIKHIKRINNVAKGLLSTSDLNIDLLLLTNHWPTHPFLQHVFASLKDIINASEEGVSYDLTLEKDSIILRLNEIETEDEKKEEKKEDDKKEGDEEKKDEAKKESGGVDEKERVRVVICQIHLGFEAVKEKKKGDDDEKDKEDVDKGAERLAVEVVQHSIKQLQQTKWFQNNANCLPSCVMVLRVIKAVCKSHAVLCCITEQTMELVMARVLGAHNAPTKPGQAFKFFVEALYYEEV